MPKGGETLEGFIARERAGGLSPEMIALQDEVRRRTPKGWLRIPTRPDPDGRLAYSTEHYRFVAADGVSIVGVWMWESEDRPPCFILQYGRKTDEKPLREYYGTCQEAIENAIRRMMELYAE